MHPQAVFSHNWACLASGQGGEGNIGAHSRNNRRYIGGRVERNLCCVQRCARQAVEAHVEGSAAAGRPNCRICGKTFTGSTSAAFYRQRSFREMVVSVATLLACGHPQQANVAAFRMEEGAVGAMWATVLALCNQVTQGERVHQHLRCFPRPEEMCYSLLW